jgi:DNA polymerase-1
MLGAYVEAPGLHAHDLAGDVRAFLGTSLDPVESTSGAKATERPEEEDLIARRNFLESERGRAFLAARARCPLLLSKKLRELWSTGGTSQLRILEEIEFPLVPILARMERTGIAVDRTILEEMSLEFEDRLRALEREIYAAAGEEFQVGSAQQLGRILFEKLGYPVIRKTARTKAYATGSDILEQLVVRRLGPVPGLALEWRELSKLKGTYVDALPTHLAADGRIHTRFDQAVAATGRLSSNEPNLQNIPIRSETGRSIRRAFVAPPGRILVAADYSQVELRILAHLSGDEALIEVFRLGEDIHRATAARIFGVDPGLVTHDQRRGAKTINFGILYGMGPFALAGQLGVSVGEAKAFIAAYFDRFPKIKSCLDGILDEARETGRTRTIFGRIRPIPGIQDRNHAVRANAERMAMNAPFQGTAADLVKMAMIALDHELAASSSTARLLLQVHDELILECGEEEAEMVAALARDTMETAAKLVVPLTVHVGIGRNWAEAK